MYIIYIYTYNTYTYIYIYNINVIFIRGHINPRRFLRLQERVDAGCHRGGTGAVAHRLRGPSEFVPWGCNHQTPSMVNDG